jgi:predicted alpha/beta-fold hydrolase
LTGLDTVRSIWDFDDLISPYNGFQGALDYYTRSSSQHFIDRIEIPTLIIHAQDDPFIPMTPFAGEKLRSNPWIIFLNPRHGGHVAFCGKLRRTRIVPGLRTAQSSFAAA